MFEASARGQGHDENDFSRLGEKGRGAIPLQERRGAGAQVGVGGVELFLVGRRVPLAQAQRGEGELEHAVAEVGGSVVGGVARRDQHARGTGLDHRAAAREDRGVARRATRRIDDLRPFRAERVEDVLDAAAGE